MHKVKELEERWFYYKAKKVLSVLLSVSASYMLFIGAYYLYDLQEDKLFLSLPSDKMTKVLGVSIEGNNSIGVEEKVPTKIKEEVIEEKIIEKPVVIEKIALVPVIPVIDMEKEERVSTIVKRHKPVKVARKVVVAKRNNYLTAKELAGITNVHKTKSITPRKTKKMNFTSTSSNYLATMKQKFTRSSSPRDALLIAKHYYKSGQYSKSEQWALSANKLNNSLEDSWLLFAKSKAKLGKKKEALTVLVSYYKKSHSLNAKRLIGQIKTGRI